MNLQESIFLKNLAGIRTKSTPFWFMRQAGRYLPEYRELRAKNSMLECIMTPELAKKITLQPFERFDLSAGIVFADILTPLQELGFSLDFKEAFGPQLTPNLTYENLEKYTSPEVRAKIKSNKIAPYTLEAIAITAKELNKKGVPLIGFSGTPFTLACYLIEGKPNRNLLGIKKWILQNPQAYSQLIELLTELVCNYIEQQVESGASAIQLFDSWGGYISPELYAQFNTPNLKEISQRFKKSCPVTPLIYYSSCTESYYSQIDECKFTALSVDWRVSLNSPQLLNSSVIQGNLDPALLTCPSIALQHEVKRIIKQSERFKGFIFNVGHGVTPETDIRALDQVIHEIRGV